MMQKGTRLSHAALSLAIIFVVAAPSVILAQEKALTFTDLMKFRQIKQPLLSEDGAWVVFREVPDRGDGSLVARSTRSDVRFEVPRGSRHQISSDSRWVAIRLEPPFAEFDKEGEDKPKPGFALLDLSTGGVDSLVQVDTFGISADGLWLARLAFPVDADADSTASGGDDSVDEDGDNNGDKKDDVGAPLILKSLARDVEIEIPWVRSFAFDHHAASIAYVVASPDSMRDGLYLRRLHADPSLEISLDVGPRRRYSELKWTDEDTERQWLAFAAGARDSLDNESGVAIYRWDGSTVEEIVAAQAVPKGWRIPTRNSLRWSKDGERLFFGFRPEEPPADPRADTTSAVDPYDTEAILSKKEVDVWHWNDPRINPQQKSVWKEEQRRTYDAVFHVSSGATVPLADSLVLGAGIPENEHSMLGRAGARYFKEITWEGEFFDLYVIDLETGEKTLAAERLEQNAAMSPGGRFVVYYRTPHWYVYDVEARSTRNMTAGLDVPFADEDHDYPEPAPGYGLGGWVDEDGAVLIYDKFDVWYVPLSGDASAVRVTAGEGRRENRTFRVIRTDKKREFYREGEELVLSSYHNDRKNWGFYAARAGSQETRRILEAEKKFEFVAKAEDRDVYLFTREDYREFPDLWVGDPAFDEPRKVTNLGAQTNGFAWGNAELVDWTSADGIPLQGVLIRPGNYEPGRRYPVIVYFYRFFSQRLHEFTEPVVNHRPHFPLYASNGYAVFLPDIRFEIGRPGFSATKAIVPGVQKLVDMGVADPDAIGLHGHSWSGYQTAFIVTQTDIFAAAVAGAPVSNMTSAYGGIRWESGRARQFQYEMSQSRLGRSLWEGRDRYIDNSPLFFADRINTPLLLMFGDEDGAVPWYQGIELYLALRRLGKDAIFLQYRGEPHHLKKYPNKLDYSIKMKEYFDHYLKGEPSPKWISEGVPYQGD